MNRQIKVIFLFLTVLIFLIVDIALVFRIRKYLIQQVLGTQHITKLSGDFILPVGDNELSYYYELKQNIRKIENPQWLGYTVTYDINGDGLNERYDYPIQKLNNSYRIITIGDSHTFGIYVSTGENYSEILENLLNSKLICSSIDNFEVINLGVPGYDISYTIKRFIKRGLKYNPDLVIWLVNSVDIDKYNDLLIPIEKNLKEAQKSSSDSLTKLYKVNNIATKKIYEIYGDKYMSSLSLKSLKTISDYYQNKLLILASSAISHEYINSITSLVNTNSSNYFFHYLENKYWNDEFYLLPDGHPNKKAHKEIANDVLKILLSNFLESCETR